MIELNQLPVSGGVFLAGICWVVIAAIGLGPMVANRSIQKSGWPQICESNLQQALHDQRPMKQSRPKIDCNQVMGIFGPSADQLCHQGGNQLFDLLSIDPLAQQKEALHQRQQKRLQRIVELAPSRCACAGNLVASKRVVWGVYAGTARLAGGPHDLIADLNSALHSPTCQLKQEALQ